MNDRSTPTTPRLYDLGGDMSEAIAVATVYGQPIEVRCVLATSTAESLSIRAWHSEHTATLQLVDPLGTVWASSSLDITAP